MSRPQISLSLSKILARPRADFLNPKRAWREYEYVERDWGETRITTANLNLYRYIRSIPTNSHALRVSHTLTDLKL